MKHYRDAITVGKVKCMYSVLHRGWLMPSGEVVRNPLKAQRLAEELDTKRGARSNATHLSMPTRPGLTGTRSATVPPSTTTPP